uniref:Uncharacterized protein n=1 Tax=Arundo donax TaxID=35708 RepID=A0A0A9C2A0_ARUDO
MMGEPSRASGRLSLIASTPTNTRLCTEYCSNAIQDKNSSTHMVVVPRHKQFFPQNQCPAAVNLQSHV